MDKNSKKKVSTLATSRDDAHDGEQGISNEKKGLLDIEKLRLSQDFAEMVGVKKKIITVPVRKPDRQWFTRVQPDESYRLETAVLELKEDRETYLVDPTLWSELPGEIIPMCLFTAVNRQGVVFLWPVRLPGAEGRQLEGHRSALEAAQLGMGGWVRVVANMSLGAYEVFTAAGDLPEPEWPDLSFDQLLEIAFKDKFIQSMDHPAIQKLRGLR